MNDLAHLQSGNGRLAHLGHVMRENPVTAVSFVLFAFFVLQALIGHWLVPYDPLATNSLRALEAPSADHWFGTDQLGRDVFSRVVVATRLDLTISVLAVAISFVIGAVLGAIAGYWGGWLDSVLNRILDTIMAFPLFVLAMGIVAALGNTVENIIYATAIINIPFYARVVRAEVNIRRESGFALAARLSGNGHLRTLAFHIFPNALPPMMVQVSLNMDEIRRQSRVLAAGARLLELPPPLTPEAAAQAGIPATERTVIGLQVVKPAAFEAQAVEDTELTARALGDVLAVDRGSLADDIATHGFRVKINRSDFWAQPEDELAAAIMAAIAAGAAQTLDAVLIAAILAAIPADAGGTFALGKAAAAGLRFDDLRGLVGTTGNGASIGENGTLRAAGVPAEMTAATAQTVIASWARFGVLVQPEAQVIVKRLDAAGAVEIVCWWGIGARVPSSSYAWRAA